jgi:simple sugar transport system permease protein
MLMDLALVAAALTGVTLLLALVLTLADYPAVTILRQWVLGAVGTGPDFLASLKNACPLILTGLAAGIAFRSGVFNIGAEGQSIVGSLFAVTLATRLWPTAASPTLAIALTILAGALGGALWGMIPAALDRLRGVPVVLSTILLNFIALDLLGALLQGPLLSHRNDGVIQSDTLNVVYLLPTVTLGTRGFVHIGFFIALAIAALWWVVQSRTTFGFELRVTGLNPLAAQYAGMPVRRRQFAILLISGAMAGIAGSVQLMGAEGANFLTPTPTSFGYAGIAVALLGRLHPAGIVAAAIFFGMLDQGAANLEFYHFPLQISDIVKGILVLLILIGTAIAARRATGRTGGGVA